MLMLQSWPALSMRNTVVEPNIKTIDIAVGARCLSSTVTRRDIWQGSVVALVTCLMCVVQGALISCAMETHSPC